MIATRTEVKLEPPRLADRDGNQLTRRVVLAATTLPQKWGIW